jgi:membrane-bound ClpP family serine protease
MTPMHYVILFAAIGAVLLFAELFIPSHALLGAAGMLSLLIAAGFCFGISARLGFTMIALLVILTPIGTLVFMQLWPKTFVGRRMTLANVRSSAATAPSPTPTSSLQPGDRGVAVTDLKPIGVCQVGGERVEGVSDRGLIAHGTDVIVVAMQSGRPVVRPA